MRISLSKNNDIINICSNNPIKITKVLNFINKYFQKKPKIYKRSFQKADVKKTHGSNLKVKSLINKKNFYPMKLSLLKTLKWYEKNWKLFN